MTNQDKYRVCWKHYPDIPIFFQPWWMDIVCGQLNWDVCLAFNKGGLLKGLLVYYQRKKFGFTYISPPPSTPYSGIWLNYVPGMSTYRQKSFEKETTSFLLKQLPDFHWLEQRCHHQLNNWLPFYWKGFSQNTRYTYLLSKPTIFDMNFSRFNPKKKAKIKRANKRNITILANEDNFDPFFNLYKKSSEDKKLFYLRYPLFSKLHQAIIKNNAGKVFIALDEMNRIHAGAYFLWDSNSAYYWCAASDPLLRDTGAASLLLYEALKQLPTHINSLDFDGSMNEGIEHFFASFGATQTPCFYLSKGRNRFFETLLFIKKYWF